MKKAFDQTVRDIKREVNKKVLKVPGIEQKVHDATCNEPWGPHGSLLADIAQATRNYNEYQKIMIVLWKRINDTGKNWRHVYKALLVLEYLVAHGSERVIDDIREHAYQISTLSDFQYIDSGGRDQGNNVRKKSQSLVALVNDESRIQHVRQKALANRDKYRNPSSTGGMHRPSSYSITGGGDRDRYDDRNYESHYGEDGNGYGREGEWASKYDDRYDRGGDRNGTASYKYDGRGGHKDDDDRGNRGNDGYGSINRSFERERDHHYDDNESYGGGKADDLSPDERRSDHKLSQQTTVSPPSYDAAVNGTQSHVQDERDGAPPAPKIHFPTGDSPPVPKEFSPPRMSPPAFESSKATSCITKEIDATEEFDPRAFVAAFSPSPTTTEMDIFGLTDSLAIVLVTSLTSKASAATNSDFGPNFVPLSSASAALNQPSEDPFGDNPFKAVLADDNSRAQPRSILQQSTATTCEVSASLQPTASENLQRFTYAPSNDHNILLSNTTIPFSPLQQSGPATTTPLPSQGPSPSPAGPLGPVGASLPLPVPMSQLEPVAHFSFPTAPSGPTLSPFGSHASSSASNGMLGATASVASYAPRPTAANGQLTPPSPIASHAHFQSPPPPTGLSATAQQPKDKFEPKSTVWADTLSRGLVDFNISGSKINPLADIGIDFDSMNRREKRERGRSSSTPVTSTITMGKAMGSGSGIGRAGATGFAPSSNTPIMGSNMGMGMRMGGGAGTGGGLPGIGMGMGGYGGGMNQSMGGMGMGMNMGMVQGAQSQHPSAAGIPNGYNPMMGTYTSQQQYSGYR